MEREHAPPLPRSVVARLRRTAVVLRPGQGDADQSQRRSDRLRLRRNGRRDARRTGRGDEQTNVPLQIQGGKASGTSPRLDRGPSLRLLDSLGQGRRREAGHHACARARVAQRPNDSRRTQAMRTRRTDAPDRQRRRTADRRLGDRTVRRATGELRASRFSERVRLNSVRPPFRRDDDDQHSDRFRQAARSATAAKFISIERRLLAAVGNRERSAWRRAAVNRPRNELRSTGA